MVDLQNYLEEAVERFNRPDFIVDDPIQVAHQYHKQQDVEIAAFFAATLAWGRRQTIIDKSRALLQLMGDSPHEFILNHRESERAPFTSFVHRTFQPDDLLYFLDFLQRHYRRHHSLEAAFARTLPEDAQDVGDALKGFHQYFFEAEYAPQRTRKHVSTPVRGSACKRLNMFLRWMVRDDDCGVDFGIWKRLSPRQLLIPLDIHVSRVAHQLNLLPSTKANWKAVQSLTEQMRKWDANDPAKYDFALFGLGLEMR